MFIWNPFQLHLFIFLHYLGISSSYNQYDIVVFDEPTLKYDIVTVYFIMVRFGAFFIIIFIICFVMMKYTLCAGCYLILSTDVWLVS